MPLFHFSEAYTGFAGIIPYCFRNMAVKMLIQQESEVHNENRSG